MRVEVEERLLRAARRGLLGHMGGLTEMTQQHADRPTADLYIPRQDSPLTTTVILASQYTSPEGRAGAHFVCDGFNDHVEIQAALDYIDSLPSGYVGEILFLEGRYDLGADVSGAYGDNEVQLRGLGPSQSIIHGDGSYGFRDLEFSLVRSTALGFQSCVDALSWSCNQTVTQVDHCSFRDCDGAIRSYLGGNVSNSFVDTNVSIHDNTFYDCSGKVIDIGRRCLGLAIHHNVMNNGFATYGIHVKSLDTDEHDDVSIIGNAMAFQDDVLVENAYGVTFIGNNGGDNLAFTDVDYFTVLGNIFDSYTETSCTNGAVPAGSNVGTGFP